MVSVVATIEFEGWFQNLTVVQQNKISAAVAILEMRGVQLGFPLSSDIKGSRLGRLRELRVQSGGDAIRVLYAFDPKRSAVLLNGGIKTGNEQRFYKRAIAEAEKLYDEHLKSLKS